MANRAHLMRPQRSLAVPYSKVRPRLPPGQQTAASSSNFNASSSSSKRPSRCNLEGVPFVKGKAKLQQTTTVKQLNESLQSLYSQVLRESVPSLFDKTILDDSRVLVHMLKSEEKHAISPTYFTEVQTDIELPMRKLVLEWMFEVFCQEESAESETFVAAVNYLDRFLSVEAIHKHQFQLLATSCLFLASKVKQTFPFQSSKLVLYTDGLVTIDHLMSWELLILGRLNWDLSCVTIFDFLNHFLHGLSLPTILTEEIRARVRLFIPLIIAEFSLAILRPSLIACGSLCTAVQHLLGSRDFLPALLTSLHSMSGFDTAAIGRYVDAVERFLKSIVKDPDVETTNQSGVPLTSKNQRLKNCKSIPQPNDDTVMINEL